MKSPASGVSRPATSVRLSVMAATIAVAGCFSTAAALADEPAPTVEQDQVESVS